MRILLCPMSDPGYLYPATAVGLELRARGHTAGVLGRAGTLPLLRGTGLPLLQAEDYGGRGGFSVARSILGGMAQYLAIRRAASEFRPDVLLTSVLCHGALLAAEVMDIPVVVLGLTAHLWDYRAGGASEPQPPSTPREWRTRETLRFYGELREQAGLRADGHHRSGSPLLGDALLLRGDPVFEYPGAVLPHRVHHVGPCCWEPPADMEELNAVLAATDRTGKPVIYVHLGRVFGGESPWPRLNAAFAGGPFQAVVELGRSKDPAPEPGSDILMVRKPWMGPLIDRAGLVLTSGTSAPVLNALLRGRPLGVSPAGSEQPLLAAACVRAGVAVHVPERAGPDSVALLRSAWDDHAMRERAGEIGRRMASTDSAARAADILLRIGHGYSVTAPATQARAADA